MARLGPRLSRVAGVLGAALALSGCSALFGFEPLVDATGGGGSTSGPGAGGSGGSGGVDAPGGAGATTTTSTSTTTTTATTTTGGGSTCAPLGDGGGTAPPLDSVNFAWFEHVHDGDGSAALQIVTGVTQTDERAYAAVLVASNAAWGEFEFPASTGTPPAGKEIVQLAVVSRAKLESGPPPAAAFATTSVAIYSAQLARKDTSVRVVGGLAGEVDFNATGVTSVPPSANGSANEAFVAGIDEADPGAFATVHASLVPKLTERAFGQQVGVALHQGPIDTYVGGSTLAPFRFGDVESLTIPASCPSGSACGTAFAVALKPDSVSPRWAFTMNGGLINGDSAPFVSAFASVDQARVAVGGAFASHLKVGEKAIVNEPGGSTGFVTLLAGAGGPTPTPAPAWVRRIRGDGVWSPTLLAFPPENPELLLVGVHVVGAASVESAPDQFEPLCPEPTPERGLLAVLAFDLQGSLQWSLPIGFAPVGWILGGFTSGRVLVLPADDGHVHVVGSVEDRLVDGSGALAPIGPMPRGFVVRVRAADHAVVARGLIGDESGSVLVNSASPGPNGGLLVGGTWTGSLRVSEGTFVKTPPDVELNLDGFFGWVEAGEATP